MIKATSREISGRYLQAIQELGKRAERGEIVGDLVRRHVRGCVTELRAAGVDTEEIRSIFDALEPEVGDTSGWRTPKVIQLLGTSRSHIEFLLFIEENHAPPYVSVHTTAATLPGVPTAAVHSPVRTANENYR